MENQGKRVLVTSNGDEISSNIAFHLAKRGCRFVFLFLLIWFPEICFSSTILIFLNIRLVLMGDATALPRIAEKIMGSLGSAGAVEVVALDMEEDKESVFDEAVGRASMLLGKLDAFVHCYSYEGMFKSEHSC